MKRQESTSILVSDDLQLIGSTLKIVFTLLVVSVQYAQYLLRWVFIMFAGNTQSSIAATKLTTPCSPPSQGGDKGEVKNLHKKEVFVR